MGDKKYPTYVLVWDKKILPSGQNSIVKTHQASFLTKYADPRVE